MRGAASWKRPPDLDFNPFVFISRIKVRKAAGDWGFKLLESTALCQGAYVQIKRLGVYSPMHFFRRHNL
jgi:hypothetical protein